MTNASGGSKKGKAGQKKGKLEKRARETRAARQKKTDGRRRASLIVAISHPLRRQILRTIHDQGEAVSPAKIARELRLPIGTVAYHARVLWRLDAVEPAGEQQVRGAVEHFYDSTIENDPPIETLLEETREVDNEEK